MKIIKSPRFLNTVEEIVCKSCSAKLRITTMECARPEGFDFFEVYKCNHTVCILFCLASFINYIYDIHPYCCMQLQTVHSLWLNGIPLCNYTKNCLLIELKFK